MAPIRPVGLEFRRRGVRIHVIDDNGIGGERQRPFGVVIGLAVTADLDVDGIGRVIPDAERHHATIDARVDVGGGVAACAPVHKGAVADRPDPCDLTDLARRARRDRTRIAGQRILIPVFGRYRDRFIGVHDPLAVMADNKMIEGARPHHEVAFGVVIGLTRPLDRDVDGLGYRIRDAQGRGPAVSRRVGVDRRVDRGPAVGKGAGPGRERPRDGIRRAVGVHRDGAGVVGLQVVIEVVGRDADIVRYAGRRTCVMRDDKIVKGAGPDDEVALRVVVGLAVAGHDDIKSLHLGIRYRKRHETAVPGRVGVDRGVDRGPAVGKGAGPGRERPGDGGSGTVGVESDGAGVVGLQVVIEVVGRDADVVGDTGRRGPVMRDDKIVQAAGAHHEVPLRVVVGLTVA